MKKIKKQLCLLLTVVLGIIAFGSSASISYAAKGDLGEGYNIDNTDAEYKTVDGEQISSNSAGIVTILMFARTNGNCMNSTAGISSLCGSSWIQNEGVRLIVVDIDSSPVETVKAMQEKNKEGTAVFCYDETYTAANRMWSYLRNTVGSDSSVTLPVTVIIDGNNKVQYCITGSINANTIYPYVANIAGWSAEEGDIAKKVDLYVEGTFDEEEAFRVLEQVNEARKAQGLSSLKMDETLMKQAMQRAAECSVYYSHTRPDGESCFSILDSNYRIGCAENIAAGYRNADLVMEGWLNSSGHYKNIMGENYKSIGIGCFYQNGVPYWTQLFSSYSGVEKIQKENSVKKTVVKADTSFLGEFSLQYRSGELKKGETASPLLVIQNLNFGNSQLSTDNITFQSSDEGIVRIDEDGTLYALSPGNVVITAVLADSLEAKYNITVMMEEESDPEKNPDRLPGDVNGDMDVTLDDALMVLKAALRIIILNEEEEKAAEVDGVDGISLDDALMVLKAALRIIQL